MSIANKIIAASLVLISGTSNASLSLDATRYIFTGDKQSLSVTVSNNSNLNYGAQTWIDNYKKEDKSPNFIATPSFFKIQGNSKQIFRIINATNNIPQDKESLYWLNVQELPPKSNSNGISMAIRTRVKLIYRPKSLMNGRLNAEKNVSLMYLPGQKYLVNKTPYIFAIGSLTDSKGQSIKLDKKEMDKLSVFKPNDRINVSGFDVKSFSSLNDYGNVNTYSVKNHK